MRKLLTIAVVAAGLAVAALADVYRTGLIFNVFSKWFDQVKLKPGPVLLSAFSLGALPQ